MRRNPVYLYAVVLAIAGSTPGFLTGCVHYKPQPLNPAATLSTLEARSTTDQQLRAFLQTNHVALTDPPRWDLRALTLTAFYFHPDLDDARAAAAVSKGHVITAGERPNPQLQPAVDSLCT